MITYSECECCEDVTVHIPLSLSDLTMDEDGCFLHLTQAEAMGMYWELKELLLHSDMPWPEPVEE